MHDAARIELVGDTSMLVEFGDVIDVEINRKVVALSDALRRAALAGVSDLVPTFRSLLIHFDPDVLDAHELETCVIACLKVEGALSMQARRWNIPVCYDESLAPDLAFVADAKGLRPSDVVEVHASADYRVFMLGFLPCQAYLGEVAKALRVPRLASPRSRIAAGSVGIAEAMTSIFPMETPCGWRLIGRSPLALLETRAGSYMQAGDRVSLVPVTLAEFKRWQGAGLASFNAAAEVRP